MFFFFDKLITYNNYIISRLILLYHTNITYSTYITYNTNITNTIAEIAYNITISYTTTTTSHKIILTNTTSTIHNTVVYNIHFTYTWHLWHIKSLECMLYISTCST